MHKFKRYLSLAFVGAFITSSCVTQKKYDELLSQKVKTDGDLLECKNNSADVSKKFDELHGLYIDLLRDTTELGTSLRKTKLELGKTQNEYSLLDDNYKNLITNSSKLSRDLTAQQQRLQLMEEDLEISKLKNNELAVNLQEREKRVLELEKILEDKDKAVKALKNKVSNALFNFKENDLTIEVKNGKVYVSLAEQLLFGSGSVIVDNKGVQALQELAKVLKDQEDINIVVEGHTDNVPMSKTSPYMSDNWDLSVIRATSIVKILTKAGVNPLSVTAAGKGEFSPLTANDNADGKRKNRRTEIILTPKLDELFQLLDNN